MTTNQVGVLLSDRTTDEQIGLITFYPRGVLGYSVLKAGLHVFALKPIERFLEENGFSQPLYVKHAARMNNQNELATDILEREAKACAEAIQRAEPPLTVGGHALGAHVVSVSTK